MLNHARCLILDDMPKRLVDRDEDMIATLIAGYGRTGIPQEAVKIFRRMPELGVTRTVRSYDALFKAILRSGRVMMAKRVFNSMIRDGVAPAASTYNTLIWGFCLSLKMETAKRFFADMKERGIAPELMTYNTLLNGWVRAKKMDDAEKVFEEMSTLGPAPNSISYNIMIKGYVSVGKVDDGLRLFGEMSAKGPRPSEKTFAALMPGLCDDVGRTEEARKVLNEMAERRLTPKDKSIFLRLVSSLCNSGDLDGALEVHRKMEQFKHVVRISYRGFWRGRHPRRLRRVKRLRPTHIETVKIGSFATRPFAFCSFFLDPGVTMQHKTSWMLAGNCSDFVLEDGRFLHLSSV
ncbi:putative Pentatricopeptide repeat-containing protein [Cocos nucifera]|uniref:Putative Pentatricopeptide repeat-containing protein n=1 Tax=Cocos nucifera TaxID=13894 RepID=A0A8K0N8H8_COCNU|nr:putative Pentatricopeptide repeat-containing protein [Cocos nucifera]